MASKNVETLRAAHESWNKRDFPGVVKNAAEKLTYTDNARAVTLNSRDKFREWTEGWAKAFSDGRITNSEYIDAGDIVIARFTQNPRPNPHEKMRDPTPQNSGLTARSPVSMTPSGECNAIT